MRRGGGGEKERKYKAIKEFEENGLPGIIQGQKKRALRRALTL